MYCGQTVRLAENLSEKQNRKLSIKKSNGNVTDDVKRDPDRSRSWPQFA